MSMDLISLSDEEFMKQSPALEASFEEAEPELIEEEFEVEENTPELNQEEESLEEDTYVVSEEEDSTEEVLEALTEDYSRILKPFKANGTEVQVRNVDEAIQLMQMGANYTKKMQGLQPNLKILKTLEKQGLLDENKLNYLIDLSNGDKGAISKLLKEHEVEWSHIDEDVEYQPTNHQVSDASIQLDEVLSSIESTPTYRKCIDVVGNQWDRGSREVLSQNPALIAQINEQMQLGVFDQIQKEVQHIKMFGGLSGMSDFEAYRSVGARLYQEGKLGQKPAPVATTQVRQQDSARNAKRKAAATPSTKKPVQQDFNPLNLSDEEFIKLHKLNI